MAVGALETSGQLGIMSAYLDKHVHEPYLISFVIGALSSCVDNVALVAATMGMYPIVQQTADLAPYAQFFVSDGCDNPFSFHINKFKRIIAYILPHRKYSQSMPILKIALYST